jgi:hypothetical protein
MMNNGTVLPRYAPLVCWLAVFLTVLMICLKIIGYGFIPPGDARRHVAKPFAHKPYSEIVVMRPQYVVDHSPGWEWFLGVLHRAFGWNEDQLIVFSFTALVLFLFCFPLIWLRHPEAWMAVILAQSIAIPDLMSRWGQARPFLLTEGILMALLFSWSKENGRNPPWWKVAATCLGFTLSVWMHGAWYLWLLLIAAFALAQRWRATLWLAGCWIVGVIVGSLLTGRPIAFLKTAVFMAACVYREHAPKWLLVAEFQPSTGEITTLTVLSIVYLWLRRQNKGCQSLSRQPIFWMILVNWVLGLSADRFWIDWGLAGAVVWMAIQFDEALPVLCPTPIKRMLACAFILAPLYLLSTNDMGRRYTSWATEPFLDAKDPQMKGWMPGNGGIFYADNMQFFYNTFYKNPEGDWRYIVGFEPALMPEADLKIYREIHRSNGAMESYKPWIQKMRPQDRLEVSHSSQPDLPELEWKHGPGDIWIGRLPAPKTGSPHY